MMYQIMSPDVGSCQVLAHIRVERCNQGRQSQIQMHLPQLPAEHQGRCPALFLRSIQPFYWNFDDLGLGVMMVS